MKKLVSLIIAAVLTMALSANSNVTAFAENGSNNHLYSTETLLQASKEVLDEYRIHYDIRDIGVSRVIETQIESGGFYVEYLLDFTMQLKYESAADLPQVQGMSEALGVDSQGLTAAELSAALKSDGVKADLAVRSNVAAVSVETLRECNATNSLTEPSGGTIEMDQEAVTIAIVNRVTSTAAEFVENLDAEYIGIEYENHIGLRVEFDDLGNIIDINYAIYKGYSDDIAVVIPAPISEMKTIGQQQVEGWVTDAADAVSKQFTSVVAPMANTSFVYYRTDARDYANAYTSNAADRECYNHGDEPWEVAQDASKYNPAYTWYCCTDCANFVSQAMLAGGVPVDARVSGYQDSDKVWCVGSKAWRGTISMENYFTVHNKIWTESDATSCNAGGIIMLYNDKGASHVMMNVLNNTVNRQYSAHTDDVLAMPYTVGTFSSQTTKFFVFANSSPAV